MNQTYAWLGLAVLIAFVACKTPPIVPASVQRANFKAGKPVVFAIMGNSVGAGAASNGNSDAPRDGACVTDAANLKTDLGSWARQVYLYVTGANATSQVWNRSCGGYTIADHLSQNTLGYLAAKSPKPTLVFIPLQINEARFNMGIPTYTKNITAACVKALSLGMTPVLVKENMETQASAPNMIAYVQAIDAISADPQWKAKIGAPIEVIDTWDGFDDSTMISADNLHPNQSGHDFIAAKYKAWLSQ